MLESTSENSLQRRLLTERLKLRLSAQRDSRETNGVCRHKVNSRRNRFNSPDQRQGKARLRTDHQCGNRDRL